MNALLSESIGTPMLHLPECRLRLRPDTLRRRIRRDELGIFAFQRLQLAKQAVVLGVGDRRRVERVVLIVVPLDLLAQRCNPLADFARSRHENRRRARLASRARCRGPASWNGSAASCCWIAADGLLGERHPVIVDQRAAEPLREVGRDAQHELERRRSVRHPRHVEQERHAARRELLHLLRQERRGLVVVERKERLLRARRRSGTRRAARA